MIKGIYKSLLILLTGVLVSCSTETSMTDQEKIFFDLDAFVEQQITLLEEQKPQVSKFVMINEETEEIKGSEIDWKKELAILKEADLNKAAYTLSYDILESDTETKYTLKAGEDLPVKALSIGRNSEGEIIKIRAELGTENYLYSSAKTAEMELENGQLINYAVKGWQKLFIGTEKKFEISGEVVRD